MSADVNHWPHSKCAKAFWSQSRLGPYRRLLADTVAWLDPRPGERWLDLGCGSGQLTRALWEKSQGTLAQIIASDCADANAVAFARLRPALRPVASEHQVRFLHHDFSHGLGAHADGAFDGIVSGLAIQYAQHYCPRRGQWTTDAYDRLLREACRVLRPGGRFVFSVNVPGPSWMTVGLLGLPAVFTAPNPLRFVRDSLRMFRYGRWLHQEARRGRFHYLPHATITAKLGAAGFIDAQFRRSFARQAYIFRCRRA